MRRTTATGLTALLALLVGMLMGSGPVQVAADHKPANKVSVAGGETEVFGPNEEATLLFTRVRTSNPADLVLSVTMECAITTDVTTVGNDDQQAMGQIEVWIEIDGNHVAVSDADLSEGRVVFCDRTYRRVTSLFDDEDATIRTYMATRSANAFNWMALNVGNGIHTIAVKAALRTTATSNASAEAVVGNRTVIIQPTHAANDESITPIES